MKEKHLLLLNRKDDKFLMHSLQYKLQDFDSDSEDLQNDYEMKKAKAVFNDLKIETYTNTQMRGYSFMWPYVAFSGVDSNTLFVVNAFRKDYIHLV